jgi:uncharacterized RDD family membrane protein YckC
MNCPECRKPLNPALSACSSCGIIVDEDVRKELGIYRLFSENIPIALQPQANNSKSSVQQVHYNQPIGKSFTSGINIKETSPTLIEFPNKNADLPEWRLKLQDAVKTRKDVLTASLPKPVVTKRRAATRGANALALDVYERAEPKTSSNPLLELAMQRIQNSRQKYALVAATKVIEQPILQQTATPVRAMPLPYLVPNLLPNNENHGFAKQKIETTSFDANTTETPTKVPRLIRIEESTLIDQANTPISMQPKIERIKTNKLPPLIPAKVSSSLGKVFSNGVMIEEIFAKNDEIADVEIFSETNENDDIPPFSMRTNSAIFDLIIGAFSSVILMLPFVMLGSNLFTMQGFFGFLGVFSLVMFLYLTISIGVYGRTFGMRLFSLEVINAADSEFPSFNQSAISSSIYLLSLALGGIGFIPAFFNEDRRATHDLLSGTIIVREL